MPISADFSERAKRFELTYKGHLGELLGDALQGILRN